MERVREDALVRRAQAGDSDAFAELVLEHQRFVFNLALRTLNDPDEAEDLSQEAFIRAWQALPRFRRKSRFQTWLYRIVVNLCYNRLPKLHKEMMNVDADQADLLVNIKPMDNPSKHLEVEELKAYLHQQIDALPESYRLLISMRYQRDLSYAEISEIVDIPLGTVKTGIFRARQTLRDALRQFEEEPAWT